VKSLRFQLQHIQHFPQRIKWVVFHAKIYNYNKDKMFNTFPNK
jgi:hypothetical protein